ncbi:MAG: hypothetical protein IJN50_04505 [Clostridia bacterium]|nr:hypothetical protein [Clostridia bacterium]
MKVSTIDLDFSDLCHSQIELLLPEGIQFLPIAERYKSFIRIYFIDNNNEKKEKYFFAFAERADETYDFCATYLRVWLDIEQDYLKTIEKKDSQLETYHIFYKKG